MLISGATSSIGKAVALKAASQGDKSTSIMG